jgi:hypothetical protein
MRCASPRNRGLWGGKRVRGKPHLCVRAEKKFGSLEPLLEYVLRNLLRMTPPRQTRESQRMIEQRLRDLGYL